MEVSIIAMSLRRLYNEKHQISKEQIDKMLNDKTINEKEYQYIISGGGEN